MAYSDFTTIRQVEKQFGVRQIRKQVFTDIKENLPSPRLLEELEEAEDLPLFSEKAKSELIIMPILKEIRRKNRTFNIFSGYAFDVDKAQSLNGICDYILSSNLESIEIKSPIFCLVEAKNKTIEEGIGQAAAEMIAAKLFNVPILFDNIQDSAQNRTRFFIIGKDFINQKSDNDKTTIIARLPEDGKPGTLVRSFPVPGARRVTAGPSRSARRSWAPRPRCAGRHRDGSR